MDNLSVGDDFESICSTSDYIPLDEEIKYLEYSELNSGSIDSPIEILKAFFPMIAEEVMDSLLQENDNVVKKSDRGNKNKKNYYFIVMHILPTVMYLPQLQDHRSLRHRLLLLHVEVPHGHLSHLYNQRIYRISLKKN